MEHDSEPPATNTIKFEEARLVRTLVTMLQRGTRMGTGNRDDDTKPMPPVLGGNPFGVTYDMTIRRLRLPKYAPRNNPTWLIELHGFSGGTLPMQIEIAGDIILGVALPGQPMPDFDLGPYRAHDRGVSRRHAMLRPSRSKLFIIDLQSTNGTYVNGLPVGAAIARELRTNDTVTLASLTVGIKILSTAADYEDARSKGVRTIF